MALNLFRTKSPEHLMAEAAAPERQLKRALSAFDLTCIGIGAIIGTGIFALAGTAAAGEQAHAVGSIWKTPVLNFVQSWTTHASLVFGRPGPINRSLCESQRHVNGCKTFRNRWQLNIESGISPLSLAESRSTSIVFPRS
jgi:hypothetical protein